MAPKAQSRANWRSNKPRVLTTIAVIAFLVIDVLLVGYALTRSDAAEPGRLAPIPTFVSSTPSPSPTPVPTEAPVGLAPPVAAPRFMVSVDGEAGWRSTAGACPGEAAVIERTTDGGATWEHTPIDDLTVHQVLALGSGSSSSVQVVGRVEAGCSIDLLASFTEGEFWSQYPDRVAEFSFVDPTNPAVLRVGGSALDAPCPSPLDLRSGASSVAVLCDGAAYQLPADSDEWLQAAVPGLLALTPNDGSGYTVAVAGVEGCAGVSVQTLPLLTESTDPVALGCIPEIALDGVTLAQSGATIWAWGGDKVWVSADGGATWA